MRNKYEKFLIKSALISDKKRFDIINKGLDKYEKTLLKWGAVNNLFSKQFSEIELRNSIVDCVLGAGFLPSKNKFFDVGSGAGLPGVICALLFCQSMVTLIESSRKKCSFLRQVKSELQLENLKIVNKRIESCEPVSSIISRAAFSPEKLYFVANFCLPGGFIFLWVAPNTQEYFEAEALRLGLLVEAVFAYEIPGKKTRCILRLKKLN